MEKEYCVEFWAFDPVKVYAESISSAIQKAEILIKEKHADAIREEWKNRKLERERKRRDQCLEEAKNFVPAFVKIYGEL